MLTRKFVVFTQDREVARRYLAGYPSVIQFDPSKSGVTLIAHDKLESAALAAHSYNVDVVTLLLEVLDGKSSLEFVVDHVHQYMSDHPGDSASSSISTVRQMGARGIPLDIQATLDEIVEYRRYLERELKRLQHAAMSKINTMQSTQQYVITDAMASHTATCKGLESVLSRHYAQVEAWWRSRLGNVEMLHGLKFVNHVPSKTVCFPPQLNFDKESP